MLQAGRSNYFASGGDSASLVKKTLHSSILGTLTLDDELFDPPIYFVEREIPGHGSACVTLVAPSKIDPDWESLLCAAESAYPLVIDNEASIRKQVAPSLLELHRTCYRDEWQGTAQELVSSIRLQHLNFFPDGSLELWYAGGPAFHLRAIRLVLDAGFCLKEVGLET
jgi:hypothetical protein